MSKDVNDWFSCAIDLECFALASALDSIKPVKQVKVILATKGEQSKTFCSSAPFHIINAASLKDL